MSHSQRVPRSLFPAVAIALALGTTLLIAGSNSTSLSNGAQLAVSITSPTTGDEFEVPPGVPTINVPVTGSASVGLGEPDATFVYVMDTSGSTGAGGGTGCSPILNCEKQFFVGLNSAVAADGSTDEVRIAEWPSGAKLTALNGLPVDGNDCVTCASASRQTRAVPSSQLVIASAPSSDRSSADT